MTKLKEFLKKNNACKDGFGSAKDLTFKQSFDECERGAWVLWLFARSNPESIRELSLAKGHCAATVRHLMGDERSRDAVQAAIDFGEGKITKKQLGEFHEASRKVRFQSKTFQHAADAASYASCLIPSSAAFSARSASYAAANKPTLVSTYAVEEKKNQKETAIIAKRILPVGIWNINQEND